ncbi:uncharacterized protein KZ484_015796 isoform 3-T4 [Pholidichthys leucotaenia]
MDSRYPSPLVSGAFGSRQLVHSCRDDQPQRVGFAEVRQGPEMLGVDWRVTEQVDCNFPQQPDCKEEVLVAQQLWNQERISVLEQQELEPPQMEEQQEPEPPQVKVEEEELFISQEGEQPEVKLEADTFMVTHISQENEQNEAEPNSEQVLSHNSAATEIQDEEGSWHVDSESIKEEEEPKPKKRRLKKRSYSTSDNESLTSKTLCENETDTPQLHDCKEEEFLTVQQLWNQESNSLLGQEEQDAAQVKEEEEELSTSQEEENFGLKQEADIFMVTPTDEDNDNNETEPKIFKSLGVRLTGLPRHLQVKCWQAEKVQQHCRPCITDGPESC